MTDQQIQMIHGDCLEVMALIPDGSVDLIVTDPPYPVISGGAVKAKPRGAPGMSPYSVIAKNDGLIFKHNNILPSDYLPHFYRILKPDADLYLMTNNLNLREFLNAAHEAGFKLHNMLAWNKVTCCPNRWYQKNLEWTLYLYKGRAKTINNPGSSQLFTCPNPRNKQHPCEKPVELMSHYILNSSQPGDTVCDPFMGSAPAAESCLLHHRRFFGIEKDSEYFAAAQNRMRNTTPSLFLPADLPEAPIPSERMLLSLRHDPCLDVAA